MSEPVFHESVPAAVRPLDSTREGDGSEVDSVQGQKSHHRLVVVSKTLFYLSTEDVSLRPISLLIYHVRT